MGRRHRGRAADPRSPPEGTRARPVPAERRPERGDGVHSATPRCRQNPRTTRPAAAPRGLILTDSHKGPALACSTASATASARPSAGLTGRGRVTEADVDAAMREVRLALLEADVNFKVVKDFVARVRERAIGAEVLESLTAGQQVVKIVNDELDGAALRWRPDVPASTATPPSSRSSASRARARRPRPPSSPGTSSSWAARRCWSPRTRTGPRPRTSSRRWARASTSPSTAPRSAPRPSTSPGRASSTPSASAATR